MSFKLDFLIVWPLNDLIVHTTPQILTRIFTHANCHCIIDCAEICIERHFWLKQYAQIYSNYKYHNTVKILIAITPCSTIFFISPCWGGKVPDKYLTQNCWFLNLLCLQIVVSISTMTHTWSNTADSLLCKEQVIAKTIKWNVYDEYLK